MDYQNELDKFESYLNERVSAGSVSAGTVRVYRAGLSQWFNVLGGAKPTRELAQKYVDALAKRRAASTVNLRAHAIMRWFRWKGRIISLDCPTVRLGDPEYLTLDQIEFLLAVTNTVLEETLIIVLFDTAVRISELLNLELNDINRKGGFISVVRKGGRREEVNISGKALGALDKWLSIRESESRRVFMDLTYYDAWTILRNVGKRAEIKVYPHIFRHSRAIHMLMNGAELHTVKEHLGHANIATTANIYGRFKAVHLKELVPTW